MSRDTDLVNGLVNVGTPVSHNTPCDHSELAAKRVCWHGPCVVRWVFANGYWVLNRENYGRIFRPDELRLFDDAQEEVTRHECEIVVTRRPPSERPQTHLAGLRLRRISP